MYEANVAAIIGPACLCNTSARIAASFDLPMISYVSTHFEFIRLDKCMNRHGPLLFAFLKRCIFNQCGFLSRKINWNSFIFLTYVCNTFSVMKFFLVNLSFSY